MTTSEKNIGTISKILLWVASLLLIISLFKPIWRIELDAPQYPEGLELLIYSNKLGGNVEIINGLNHYIGMRTLHAEDFIEFTLLPYIIGVFALAALIVPFIARKKALNILFITFVLFGIIAMIDFWRWEYNYGHNLDPNAAIVVPGMAYQPPLIGFKQLLNFGAYSIPAIGGWMFIASGLLMAIAFFKESGLLRRITKNKAVGIITPLTLFFSSCNNLKVEPIKLNHDKCNNCGMTLTDPKFAAELITQKGRIYKFDDISCMVKYNHENKSKTDNSEYYIADFTGNHQLISVKNADFISSDNLKSPMGGNIAAFSNKDSSAFYLTKFDGKPTNWTEIGKE